MTFHHRLHVYAEIAQPILDSLGLRLTAKPTLSGRKLLIEDVSEDDPSWPRIATFLEEYHRAWLSHPESAESVADYGATRDSLADIVTTEFSVAERRAAPYLALGASVIGFPEPRNDAVEFYRTTYEAVCPECPVGPRQTLPLCLTSEPRWGRRRGILQLNWVSDEFLVNPEMFDKVFRPFGITSRPVLAYKSRSALRTVIQLEIPLKADVRVTEAAVFKTCKACGVRTYSHDRRNYAPMPVGTPGPIFKSNQYFCPFDLVVYVTQSLFRAIEESGFRGAGFWPCAAQPITPAWHDERRL